MLNKKIKKILKNNLMKKVKYNNNFAAKNMYYNSIIKKKLALLDELENNENNKTLSRIVNYKNTIPNNFKKNKKIKKVKNKQNPNRNVKIMNI